MKKKERIITIICVIAVLVSVGGYFGIKYFLDKDIERQQKELEEVKNNIVYSEEESINISVAKFNTEILDNGMQYPLSDDYLLNQDENYYYGIYDDISFYATPIKYTGNKEKDITKDMAIYYPKDSKNEEMAQTFIKHLIKANNNKLSDEEITSLIKKSESLAKEGKAADENNGIFISYNEDNDNKFYIVTRHYKTDK